MIRIERGDFDVNTGTQFYRLRIELPDGRVRWMTTAEVVGEGEDERAPKQQTDKELT
jgi:hypothetical protein